MLEQFINGPLAEEHGLDDSETDKPLLDAVDFVELLRCHWVTDTNTLPHERQRVQLATILLFAAFTGSRRGALLGLTYRDLDLFVQRDKTTGEVVSIHDWLKEVYRGARGFELGTLNSSLLAVTMKRQSRKWKILALGYIADIVTLTYHFVTGLLRVVCPVERV